MIKNFERSLKPSVYRVGKCFGLRTINSRDKLYRVVPRYSHRSLSTARNRSWSPHNRLCNEFSSGTTRKMSVFKFTDYDCVGFDLDNTLLRYNVTNMVHLEYNVLVKFLVEQRGYDGEYLYKPLRDQDIDFMQKGLILDFDKGNVIKLSSTGEIRRVSHGTQFLSEEDISKIYPNRRWEATDDLVENTLDTWNGPVSLRMRCLLDYFDMPSSLAFARAVDSIDAKNSGFSGSYTVWPDILDGLIHMFFGKNFGTDEGDYFPALKRNPEKYLRKCSEQNIAWLKDLKRKKVTFLLTGSYADFADFTASYALGDDWKSLFDIVICHARKPGFFTEKKSFVAMSGYDEDEAVTGAQLTKGRIYSQGNWKELKQFCGKICKNNTPKCLYVGDNMIQDIYVVNAHADFDTVAICEELQSEGIPNMPPHPDEKSLNSNCWGSYFSLKDSEGVVDSLWCHIAEKYSKICVPSMELISEKPIDEPYECFDKNNKERGFHPSKP